MNSLVPHNPAIAKRESSRSNLNMEEKTNVAVLGGSFDPPTISHLQMCSEAINLLDFDAVEMIPCGDRKDKTLRSNGADRLKMCQLAIDDFFPPGFPIEVNDVEIQNGTLIPTYTLMKILEGENPDCNFYFIIGTDLVPSLHRWENGPKMLKEINFIIYQRQGYDLDWNDKSMLPENYIFLNPTRVILSGISSTEVRTRIQEIKVKLKEETSKKQEIRISRKNSKVEDLKGEEGVEPNSENMIKPMTLLQVPGIGGSTADSPVSTASEDNSDSSSSTDHTSTKDLLGLAAFHFYYNDLYYNYFFDIETNKLGATCPLSQTEETYFYPLDKLQKEPSLKKEPSGKKENVIKKIPLKINRKVGAKKVTHCQYYNVSGLITKSVLSYVLEHELY